MGLRIAAWNVEWFANLFSRDGALLADDRWSARHDVTRTRQAEAVAAVIAAVDPDMLMIIEGPDEAAPGVAARALEGFAARYGLRQRQALTGFANGTRQEIALLYDPAVAEARHDPQGAPWTPPRDVARMTLTDLPPGARAPRFDGVLPLDIDADGLVDLHVFSKPPLEAAVRAGGRTLRLIGVHAKSKAPHGARDEAHAVRLHVANRRKQLAQCEWVRRRVDDHLDADDEVIVLGDFNDGPGLDRYERLFGRSGVEVVMGSVDRPARLLRNPYARARLDPALGWRPATARFYDARRAVYVNALIDFVMLSPALAEAAAPEWRIWHPFDDPTCYADERLRAALLDASDHFPVSVDLNA